ncbi:MAG: CHAT domain-containing protein, partial [Acidobacteriaceae bacterium]|nr:CHAT domain-containing protein [Acidobacteriaceae bacterium]
AGAASVIASHWDVNDEVASELIEVLYRELDRGVSKVEALRRAQIEVRKKHKKPDDWAAFSLTGDPGEPFSNTATRLRIGIITAIVLLFMGVLTYLLAARIRLQLKMQATADKPLT